MHLLRKRGKQLVTYTSVSTGSKERIISFDYDENGLRTQKIVNNVVTNYYYNGSLLMGMTAGGGADAISRDSAIDAKGNYSANAE